MVTVPPVLPRRYCLIRPLGRGGQGRVYLVRDAYLDQAFLALKVLDERGEPEARAGAPDPLSSEFLVLSRLAHPSLARVRDFGRLPGGGPLFFTSDYAPGLDVLAWGLEHPFPVNWPSFYSIAAQALGALHAIHSAGYVHGDVKPAHLVLKEDPAAAEGVQLTLIDFGSARLSAALCLERRGTPAYLAPAALGAGPEADLYALGMSLFHALTGRLPFALGDPAGLDSWRRAGLPARPGEWIEEVPRTAAELVERLTATGLDGRFRAAGEALEFLGRRTAAGRALPVAASARCPLAGRDRELEEVLSAIDSPGAPLVAVAAPRGLGKSRLLEEAMKRAQLLGFQTVLASARSPERALGELYDLIPDPPGPMAGLPPRRLAALLLERVFRLKVLVGLDGTLDPSAEPGAEPAERSGSAHAARAFEALVRGYLASPPGPARIVLTTSRPDRLRSLSTILPSRWREVRLAPLGGDSLRAMAVDFFRTAAIPEPVVARLLEASAGAPGRAREELAAMAAEGARTDPLGMLIVPERAPQGASRPGPEAFPLPPLERAALVVAALSPRPVGPGEVARHAPELGLTALPAGDEAWEIALDALFWKGLLTRAAGDPGRYGFAEGGARLRWTSGIQAEILCRVRRAILRDLREEAPIPETRDPDLLAALARAAGWACEPPLAARALLRAVRALRARQRGAEALALLREIVPALSPGSLPRRSALLLSLREAETALHHGSTRDGAEAAARLAALLDAGAPAGWRARALAVLAEICEQSGRFGDAVEKLEAALDLLGSGGRDRNRHAAWFELSGRLSSLYFSAERPAQGTALLERGSGLVLLLESSPSAAPLSVAEPPADDLPRSARALALFGALHLRHGEARLAVPLLEASLRLARAAGRSDLAAGPLHQLALIHAAEGRSAESERALRECERLAEATGERSSLLRARVNLATLYQKRGELDRAEELFLAARVLADEVGEEGPAAASWMGLMVSRLERGELVDALRLGRGILHRFRRSRPAIRATTHFNLGEIYLSLGRPETARRHRARALALARACDYRFLVRFGLVGLGGARWAVGDLAGARRRLEAALRLAGLSRSGPPSLKVDQHLAAAAHLYLGLSLRREPALAARALGRAMFHSRRAVSRTHLEGALLALVEMLLRGGNRPKAAAILARSAPASPGRHRFFREALGIRARPDWTRDLPNFLALLDRAEEAGHLLDALRAAGDAVADPAWNDGPPAALLARRELLSGKFFRHCRPRERAFLRPAHVASGHGTLEARPVTEAGSSPPPSAQEQDGPGFREIAADPLLGLAGRWAAEAALETEAELERLRTALSVRSLWVLNDPQRKEPMFYGCGEGGPPLDLFSARSAIIEKVRRTGGTLLGQGFALTAIPGDSGGEGGLPRVLYLEWGSPDSSGIPPARLELAAGVLGCFLRVQRAEASRRADRSRLRESSREIHRLNALIASGRVEVETAVITQRLGMVEERKAQDAERFASGPLEPVSESRAMKELLKRLRKVAAEDLPVLLIGEHGVGKDLLARSIHWASPRRSGPFVSEVCAVPESLLESELFGFVRGAFTDAVADRPGLLQLCSGGTLYLDEISEMSPGLQSRLLRVIEERRARPIGAEAPVDIDFRLVSSTCTQLGELERNGALRQDLFYRIRGEVLEVPALRDRREDIPGLVRAFAVASAREGNLPVPEIEPRVLSRLAKLEWPGNVRQLENAVRRAFLLDPRRLTLVSFAETEDRHQRTAGGGSGGGAPPDGTALLPLRAARLGLERDLVLRALTLHGGNASRAARALRISRRYLGTLMEKHRIRLADFSDQRKGAGRRAGPGSDLH